MDTVRLRNTLRYLTKEEEEDDDDEGYDLDEEGMLHRVVSRNGRTY
jgi:hypothetical protein